MRTTRVLLAIALIVMVSAFAFARGETPAGGGEVSGGGERSTFDHEWNEIRQFNTPADYTSATGKSISSYNEAPMLAAMVASGDLPPVEERVSDEPLVIAPYHEIGQYGGYATVGRDSTGHFGDGHFLIGIEQFAHIIGDLATQAPNVATGWELSADAKTLTVHLREGIRWSDGEPFTSEDIKFWYEDIIGNEVLTPNPAARWIAGGELIKMEFPDAYTFKYVFSVPQPAFPESLAEPNDGVTPMKHAKHYFSQFLPKYTDEAELTAMAQEEGHETWDQLWADRNRSWSDMPLNNPDRPTISAHVLKDLGTDLTIWERNPYYWKVDIEGNQLPYMDGIHIELVQDMQVYIGKILSGDFTFSGGWYAPLSEYTLLKENEASGDFSVYLWPSLEGSAATFQLNRTYADPVLGPLFADKRLSQALSMAIDRDEINNVLFQGLATPRQMTLVSTSVYFEPRFAEAYASLDLDSANALLDDLGLEWDSNNEWRLLSNGDRFSILIDLQESIPPLVELVAEQWKEVGLDLQMKAFAYEQQSQRAMTNETQMFMSAGFNARDEAFAASPLFFLPARQGWENPWGNQWALWYETDGAEGIEPPEEVKQNIERWERMKVTQDMAEKQRLGNEILASQAENLWTFGTVGEVPTPMAVSNKLRNLPERGGHDWSIGAWTGPQHPATFYLLQD